MSGGASGITEIEGKFKLSQQQIEQLIHGEIESLRKQVKALEAKLIRRDRTIEKLRDGMDVTKEVRERIRGLSEALVGELVNNGWSQYED